MGYSIFFKPAAKRQLRKLSRQAQDRLLKRIEQLAEAPYPTGAKKLKGELDLFRIRAGDYRIIYTIQNDRFVVLIVKVGNRRDIYGH